MFCSVALIYSRRACKWTLRTLKKKRYFAISRIISSRKSIKNRSICCLNSFVKIESYRINSYNFLWDDFSGVYSADKQKEKRFFLEFLICSQFSVLFIIKYSSCLSFSLTWGWVIFFYLFNVDIFVFRF